MKNQVVSDETSSFDELEYLSIANGGAPDYPIVAHANALGKTCGSARGGVWNEVSYRAVNTADVNTPMPAWVISVFAKSRPGFRIDGVQRVADNSDAAWPSPVSPDCK